jgi:hypothetical protein
LVHSCNKLYIESTHKDILKEIRSWAKDKNWYRQVHDLALAAGICLYYQPTLSAEEVSRVIGYIEDTWQGDIEIEL